MLVQLRLATLVFLAGLTASPTFAEVVIYRGMIGKSPILLELSQPAEKANSRLVGRYFYASKGVDIPLEAASVKDGKITLNEERPCMAKICHNPPDGRQPKPPIGARWDIELELGGAGLTGMWTSARTGKSLPFHADLVNARQMPKDFDDTTQGLTSIVDGFLAGENALTTLNSPYDFMKFDEAHYVVGPPKSIGGSSYAYWSDPRTKFAFPHIVDLGGADTVPANDYLDQQHWLNSAAAFSCESQIYQGFGWLEGSDSSVGTPGGVDETSFEVTYLSPTIMSWTDGGSEFCGGAHPDNHVDHNNLDVRAGKPLDLSRIFTDWMPTPIEAGSPTDLASARAHPDRYTWGPDRKLQDFVLQHLPDDAGGDPDCTSPETIASHLDISFGVGDRAIFAIDRMPFVNSHCDADLFSLPVSELKPWLTKDAPDYFPSLKNQRPNDQQ